MNILMFFALKIKTQPNVTPLFGNNKFVTTKRTVSKIEWSLI